MSEKRAGPSLRRRWQRFVLRTQGRLDGGTADRLLPWTLAVAAFALYVALDAAAIRSLEGGSGLAPWLQAAWRRQHGGAGVPLGGLDPATASWSLIAEPILALCRLVPAEAVFSVVQAAALAVAVVPLWRIAREEAQLRVGATLTVVTAFLLAPTLQRTNLSAFHPEAIALPALLWAYLHGRRGNTVRYALFVALVLACRADLGISVVALGLLLALTGQRRLGLVSAGVGALWTAMAVVVIGPQLPAGALTPAGEFVARATSPLAVVPSLFTHPLDSLSDLVSEPSVLFLVVVLAPLLFLPLVSPRNVSVAAAALVLAMIADTEVQRIAQRGVIDLSPAAAHVAPAMAFVFIALIWALERIGERSVTRVNVDHRVLLALLAGATLFFLAEAPTSPYRQPWAWGSRDVVDGARLEAVDLIHPSAPVAVSPSVTAQVAERPRVVELPPDPVDLTPERIERISRQVGVVLLDTTGTQQTTQLDFWTPDDLQRVLVAFVDDGFATAYDAQGVYLLVRPGQVPPDASG